ncbi:MAG: type I phosphomannose isomerase catalytic subunit [Terracidiphilus sp.]|jgi:mannose-6-phosphate isomerase
MDEAQLYPLRFEPIYQYRLWGGRRLSGLLSATLPGDGPIGEAWVLSDRTDYQSLVVNGPLKGQTVGQVMEQFRGQVMGRLSSRFHRFPLLLKFLDAHEMLSVQVHPSDESSELIPAGDTAKTEAWVVIEAEKGSQIYAGLKSGTTAGILRESLFDGTIAEHLVSISPKPGDAVFIPAGTVHTLGNDVVVFEVQQNSDATFRLYDWGHIDTETKELRPLQVEQAFACIKFGASDSGLVAPLVEATTLARREKLFDCPAFLLWRVLGHDPFTVGAATEPRVLVGIEGSGQIMHNDTPHALGKGDVWLLPAETGECVFQPSGEVTLLEIAIP